MGKSQKKENSEEWINFKIKSFDVSEHTSFFGKKTWSVKHVDVENGQRQWLSAEYDKKTDTVTANMGKEPGPDIAHVRKYTLEDFEERLKKYEEEGFDVFLE